MGHNRGRHSTYWMATRPSTLPTAKPFAAGKQETTLVCHFNGDTIVYSHWSGFISATEFDTTHFERSLGLGEVENLDMALSSAHNHKRIGHIYSVAPFRELNRTNGCW